MCEKITNRIFLAVCFCVFMLCCKRQSGLSEYSKSISERTYIVESFNTYAEVTGRNPSGNELKYYIFKNNDAFMVEGWIFGGGGSKFLAYKKDIKTSSGEKVEIMILRDGDYKIK